MFKKYSRPFFCFSPPVMMATFIVEIVFAVYIVWRYKLNQLTRLVIAMLVLLALFQLAEFMVCGGYGLNTVEWARVGYISISLLPPVGIHIAHNIARTKNHWLVALAYATSIPFILYYMFATTPFTGQECLGNYVIFQIPAWVTTLYSIYYYGWTIFGMAYAWKLSREQRVHKTKRALVWFGIGYAAFLLPTTTVNLLQPETLSGIPSIMCGFAVLLAFIVVMAVMPLVGQRRALKQGSRQK